MISVVTAYFNRKELFKRTLESINKTKYKGDFEVIAVDDASDDAERLEDLVKEFSFLKIIRIEKKNKWYFNSCIPFNIGFQQAKGDKIIIQNPECLHYDDILDSVDQNLNDTNYLSFACFSLDKFLTEDLISNLNKSTIPAVIENNNHIVRHDGNLGWYNHSVYRSEGLHFCCAISSKNLFNLGGFDESFSLGKGFDDNEFIFRIKKMGLRVEIIDNQLVLHQNHYNEIVKEKNLFKYDTELSKKNKKILFEYTYKIKKYKSNIITKHLKGKYKLKYIQTKLIVIFTIIRVKSFLLNSLRILKSFVL